MATATTTPPKDNKETTPKPESNWKFYLLMGFLGFLALVLIGTIIYFMVRGRSNKTPVVAQTAAVAPQAVTPVAAAAAITAPVAEMAIVPSPVPVGTPSAIPSPSRSAIPTAELPPFVPMYGPAAAPARPDSFNFTPTPNNVPKVGGRGKGKVSAATKTSWRSRARK